MNISYSQIPADLLEIAIEMGIDVDDVGLLKRFPKPAP